MNQQTRVQRLLEDVLSQPGNDRCADCHAPSPRWASTNLGIFLCVQCASQHRRLGTHQSRVKSVTLDEWTREQVVHMRSLGNAKSNAIYNPDERRHPPPLQAGEERDSELFRYIRRKYELGAFKAGAAPALSQVPINSRVTAQQARSASGGSYQASIRSNHTGSTGTKSPATPTFGSQVPPVPKRPELADIVVSRERDLPALPSPNSAKPSGLAPPPTRARAPTWSGDGLAPPRPTPVRSSSANALRQNDLLVDTTGSSSATRPLQLGGFPAVAYQGPHAAHGMPPNATPGFAPLASPGYPAPSPLALGQQAFQFPVQPQQQFQANNPFGQQMQMGMLSPGSSGVSPMHTGSPMMQSPMSASPGSMGMQHGFGAGMNMGGMNGGMSGSMSMGSGMSAIANGPNGYSGQMNGGMNGMNGMGMGMNGGMNGMHMGQQQQYQYGAGFM